MYIIKRSLLVLTMKNHLQVSKNSVFQYSYDVIHEYSKLWNKRKLL